MKLIHFINLFFVTIVCSCSNDEPVTNPVKKETLNFVDQKKRTDISIYNGPRQGFQYIDPLGEERGYRYITTTVFNDSIVPINIKIAFGKEYDSLRSNKILMSEVFLLPRELTPKQQQFDQVISEELKKFLDPRKGRSDSLNITLNPKEKCVMTFGILTKLQHKDPFTIELKLMNSNLSTLSLALVLSNPVIIPCGQISFSGKVPVKKENNFIN